MPVMFWEDLLKLLWVLSDILGMFGEDSHFDHIFQVGLVQPPPVLKNLFSQQRKWKTPVGHGLDWFWIPTLDSVQLAASAAGCYSYVVNQWIAGGKKNDTNVMCLFV